MCMLLAINTIICYKLHFFTFAYRRIDICFCTKNINAMKNMSLITLDYCRIHVSENQEVHVIENFAQRSVFVE